MMDDKIFDNSETLQSFAETYYTYTKEEVVTDTITIFNCGLSVNECKQYLLNMTDTCVLIKFTDNNILTYIHLAEYYCFAEKIIIYVVDEYILKCNKFYEILCNHESINKILIDKFSNGFNNNITNETFEYLHKINILLFDQTKKLDSRLINDDNLQKFKYLNDLDISCNNNATNNGIKHLQLHTLSISCNKMITNEGIKHMHKTLRILCIACSNLITDEGLKDLQLHTLYIPYNKLITNKGIRHMQLHTLHVSRNKIITNEGIRHMRHSLHVLHADGSCKITDEGIKDMNLTELNASHNKNITNEGIKDMNLTELYASSNNNITKEGVNHMTNIKCYDYL
jgi:hypothetical protein